MPDRKIVLGIATLVALIIATLPTDAVPYTVHNIRSTNNIDHGECVADELAIAKILHQNQINSTAHATHCDISSERLAQIIYPAPPAEQDFNSK